MRQSWDEKKLRSVIAMYGTKADFRRGSHAAYIATQKHFPRLLNECFPHRPSKYTESVIRERASKFTSLKAFERGDRPASEALGIYFPHLKWELFNRKIMPPNHWTFETLSVEATKYRTKEDFYRGSLGAYSSANRIGILNDLGFESGATSTYDVIYIWRADGQFYNGEPVYKIGVTSSRLGVHRVLKVAQHGGFKPLIIRMENTGSATLKLESELLGFGENPCFYGFNGSSEFRAVSDDALWLMLSKIDLECECLTDSSRLDNIESR